MKRKTPLPPNEALELRRTLNLDVLQSLRYSISQFANENGTTDDLEILKAIYLKIDLCNQPINSYVAKNMISSDGRRFDGSGQYWRCGSRLCANCVRIHSRNNRKKLRDAISWQLPRFGERYRFITLTIPQTHLEITALRAVVNRAWRLFTKRSLCVSLIRGGAKSEEFTVRPDSTVHYHIHLFALAKYIERDELKRVWSDCVKTAFEEAGETFSPKTYDGQVMVDIRLVRDVEAGVLEVAKYITKSESWSKLNPDVLLQFALIRQWSRMFELLGSFRNQEASLDKRSLNAEQESSDCNWISSMTELGYEKETQINWRDRMLAIGFDLWAKKLLENYEQTIECQREFVQLRHPNAEITSLADILRSPE